MIFFAAGLCAGIRALPSWRGRFWFVLSLASARQCLLRMSCRCGFAFSMASALCLFVLHASPLWVCLFAGIRVMTYPFKRRPCAGRHLLFFAAAKKSRQKKAAHTANISSCLRALNRSRTSHGNVFVRVRCQRFEYTPHPLQTPAQGQAAANGLCRPGGKLCVGCRVVHVSALTWWDACAIGPK